ncbi:MAG: hypothetical protein ACYDD2_04445 [Candidatus Acidiferrales bacterium]
MAERQILISFDELDRVEISCQCGTGIVISALNSAPKLKDTCPGCEKSLHSAATAIQSFRAFYSAAKQFVSEEGRRIELRVKEE